MSRNDEYHPLLTKGDCAAGALFVRVLCDVVDNPKHRINRGYTSEVCDAISAGIKKVPIAELQQLLVDYYTAYPKRVGKSQEYKHLKAIAEGTWKEFERARQSRPEVSLTPKAPVAQIKKAVSRLPEIPEHVSQMLQASELKPKLTSSPVQEKDKKTCLPKKPQPKQDDLFQKRKKLYRIGERLEAFSRLHKEAMTMKQKEAAEAAYQQAVLAKQKRRKEAAAQKAARKHEVAERKAFLERKREAEAEAKRKKLEQAATSLKDGEWSSDGQTVKCGKNEFFIHDAKVRILVHRSLEKLRTEHNQPKDEFVQQLSLHATEDWYRKLGNGAGVLSKDRLLEVSRRLDVDLSTLFGVKTKK